MSEAKVWTRESIVAILEISDDAVKRALVVIDALQTQDERRNMQSTEHNGVGWSKFDARVGTSLATWYKAKGWLTPKQIGLARKIVMKYSGQLAAVANGKIEVVA